MEPAEAREPAFREQEQRPAAETEDDRAGRADEAGERGDDDQPHQDAVDGVERTQLQVVLGDDVGAEHRREQAGGGGEEGRDHDHHRLVVEGEHAPRVEAEPAHPEQKDGERQPARAELDRGARALAVTLAPLLAPDLAEDGETGGAGGAVHDEAAGEVDHPPPGEPAGRVPDPGCGQVPDQDEVDERVAGEGGQLDLVQDDEPDQRERDRGEGGLEEEVGGGRQPGVEEARPHRPPDIARDRQFLGREAAQEEAGRVEGVADDAGGGGREGGVEADEGHDDERRAGHQDRLQQADVELLAELADLEEADRDRHREDEQRGDQHPQVVDRMEHERRFRLGGTKPCSHRSSLA